MRLLFDQNLSFKLCNLLADLFPGSTQVGLIGMDRSEDAEICAYARNEGYVIVTHDVDFLNLAVLRGFPAKIIWLRCGNKRTSVIEALLRKKLRCNREIRGRSRHCVLGARLTARERNRMVIDAITIWITCAACREVLECDAATER